MGNRDTTRNAWSERAWNTVPLGATILLLALAFPLPAQDFKQLTEQLADNSRDVRREAALQLSELGARSEPALDGLIGALGDDDEQVFNRAVTAIARIGPKAERAIPALIESMKAERLRYNEQAAFRSAFALAQIGEAAVPALRGSLDDRYDNIRMGCAQALGLLGERAVPALDKLHRLLGDGEREVRDAAAVALGAIGPRTIPGIRAMLAQNPNVQCARAAGLVGPPALPLAPLLIEGIANEGEDFQVAALVALGQIGYAFEAFQPHLSKALRSDSTKLRHAAGDALLRYSESIAWLRLQLDDEDPTLREHAAIALGNFGADALAAAPALVEQLATHPESNAFERAVEALGPTAIPAVLEGLRDVPIADLRNDEHWARRLLDKAGPIALDALARGLDSPHIPARYTALRALGQQGRLLRPHLPRIVRLADDDAPEIREAALATLAAANFDDARLYQITRRRIADPAPEVRAVAIGIASRFEDRGEELLPAIIAGVGDNNAAVRSAALAALPPFGADARDATDAVAKLADDQDAEIRAAALRALAAIGADTQPALAAVEKALADPEPQVRAAAVAAYAVFGTSDNKVAAALDQSLGDSDQGVRHSAIRAVGELGEAARPTAPRLFQMLDNDDDRTVALDALRRIRSTEIPLYIKALDHNEPQVRLYACEALGRIGPPAAEAVDKLKQLERDRYDFVRSRATDAILRIGAKSDSSEPPARKRRPRTD